MKKLTDGGDYLSASDRKYIDEKKKKEKKKSVRKTTHLNKGRVLKPCTEEMKAHLSVLNKGKKMSDESKKKMSSAKLGKKYTKSHKKNMSNAAKARWAKVSKDDRRLLMEPMLSKRAAKQITPPTSSGIG